MPKQEHKILEFHGGSNNKADPRDIPGKQNAHSSLSIRKPGLLTMEGSFKNKHIAAVDNHSGIFNARGLFFIPSDSSILKYITYKESATGTNATDTNGALFLADYGSIHMYTNNAWNEDVFSISNIAAALKTDSHYCFGGFRPYIADYGDLAITGGCTLDGTSATYNEYGDDEGKLLTSIKMAGTGADLDNFPAGNIVYLGNGEQVMCVSYDDSSDVMRCIRGFSGTHSLIHDYNATVKNTVTPKFFGIIDKSMFSETDNPEDYNIWVEDTLCLQQPRNTGHSIPVSGNSPPYMDIDNEKALAVYQNWSGDAPLPTNSEKVRLYFQEGNTNSVGISAFSAPSELNVITATTPFPHGFSSGEIVTISNTLGDAGVYVGTWKIDSVGDTEFKFTTLNTHSSAIAAATATIQDSGGSGTNAWTSYTSTAEADTVYAEGSLKIEIHGTDIIPGSNGDSFWFSLEDIEGGSFAELNDKIFEGIKINATTLYFATNVPDTSLDGGTLRVLHGVARDSSYGEIDDNLKRAWKFGISWLYDSPDLQEQQESLITTAWKSSLDELNNDEANREAPSTYWETIGGSTEGNNGNNWNFASGGSFSSVASSDATTALDGSYAQHFAAGGAGGVASIDLNSSDYLGAALIAGQTYRLRLRAKHTAGGEATFRFSENATLSHANHRDVYIIDGSDTAWRTIDITFKYDATNTPYFGIVDTGSNNAEVHINSLSIVKESEMDETTRVNCTGFESRPIMHLAFNHLSTTHRWNERISGFNIYMKDVTSGEDVAEWRAFCNVDFNRGMYRLPVGDNSEYLLERTAAGACTTPSGTIVDVMSSETYTTKNFYTPETLIDAQFKTSTVAGNRTFIGNVRQGGNIYPDKMLYSPQNKFDVFPETNFIDVATNDGEAIVHLEAYKDSLLQFKQNTVYVINIAKMGDEYLEHTFKYVGIKNPSQVCLTDKGICWLSDAGLMFFDGENLANLTENVEDLGFTTIVGANNTDLTPVVGYDSKSNRVIYTPKMNTNQTTKWYIFDFNLNAHSSYIAGDLTPYSHDNANYYTNMVNVFDGELVLGHIDTSDADKIYFYKWDNDGHGFEKPGTDAIWKSKDIDFGSPATRKKIYKIYVTYKTTGHSGITMKYATDGGTSLSTFDATSSTNYTDSIFQHTDGDWAVAELKPSSSINNIKSLQLQLLPYEGTTLASAHNTGQCQSSGDSTSIILNNSGVSTLNYYQNYNIGLYDGPARFNVRKITGNTNDTAPDCTVAALTDNGYTNSPTGDTFYYIGCVSNDFTINDITIVYRAKRIK